MSQPCNKKRVLYDKEVMDKALEAVKSGMSINTASKLFKVPRSSLHSKVINKYNRVKIGPGTVLTSKEEDNLVQWILHMCSLGCPVNKEHLINSVAVLMKKWNKQNPFVDGRPGRHWYEAFLRRHPVLRKRICENVSLSRALVNEDSVKKWFKDVGDYLKKENLENIDGSRIFNTDETALLLNPKGGSVLARRGSKNVYNIVNNNEKENLTVLVTGNAAGQLAPTLVVFNYKRVPNNIYSTLPKGFQIGTSEKGWMTAMLFYEYIANKFWPWILTNNIQLSIILFLDGHISHLTQPLSEFCHTHQIVLIVLPPNTTHFMQPMDVSMFSPLKDHWRKKVNNYRIEKEVLSVSKEDFASLLEKVFNDMDLVRILSNGFQICGLHPFSVERVDFTKVFIRSKTNKQPDTETTSKNESSNKLALVQSIEKYIDQSTLETFRFYKNIEEWAGPIEDKNLFYLWKKIVNDCDQTVAECNNMVVLQNSNDQEINSNIICTFYVDDDGNVHSDELSQLSQNLLIDDLNNNNQDENQSPNINISNKINTSKDLEHQVASNNNNQDENQSPNINISNKHKIQHKINTSKDLEHQVVEDIKNCIQIRNIDQSNTAQDIVSQNLNSKVPSQFKEFIFWPKRSTTKNKRAPKIKMPSVLSSEEGLKWYNEQAEKKRKIEEEKELKKRIRTEKNRIKKEETEKKRQLKKQLKKQ